MKYYLIIRQTEKPIANERLESFVKKHGAIKVSDNRYEWNGPSKSTQVCIDAQARIAPFRDFLLVIKAPRIAAKHFSKSDLFNPAIAKIDKTRSKKVIEEALRECEAYLARRSIESVKVSSA